MDSSPAFRRRLQRVAVYRCALWQEKSDTHLPRVASKVRVTHVSLNEREARLTRMLVASLCDQAVDKSTSLQGGIAFVWSHPQIRAELIELFTVLAARIDHQHGKLDNHPNVPLQVHARYTRLEILAACRGERRAKVPPWQTGVSWEQEEGADLLAFTLDKTSGQFSPTTRYKDYAIFVDSLYRKPWVVYAKRPFAGADHVFQYLGRYTHRVAISNQRIKAADRSSVRFVTRGSETSTLPPDEFIRRFLVHVLPAGFVKIRHYGLLAPAKVSTDLERARALLNVDIAVPDTLRVQSETGDDADWRVKFAQLTGIDLVRCPRCEIGAMIRHPLPRAALPRPDG